MALNLIDSNDISVSQTGSNIQLNASNDIKNQGVYSETETKIGTWIDGKPIYRKIIDFGALPNTSEKQVLHNITNLKMVVSMVGTSKNPNLNVIFNIPLSSTSSLSSNIYMFATATGITIGTGSDRTAFTETYVAIEYTKTTD